MNKNKSTKSAPKSSAKAPASPKAKAPKAPAKKIAPAPAEKAKGKAEGKKLAGDLMKQIGKGKTAAPKSAAPAKKPAAPAAATPPLTPKPADFNPPSKLSAKRTAAANKKAPAAAIPPTPPAAKPAAIPPTPPAAKPVAPAPAPAPAPAAPAAFQPQGLVLMDGSRLATYLRPVDAATAVIRAHGEAVDWTIALDRLTLPPAGLAPKKKRYESKTEASSNYHNCIRSTCEKPIAVVKRLCAENPGAPRKDVLALCIAAGVNPSTAATQYSIWRVK